MAGMVKNPGIKLNAEIDIERQIDSELEDLERWWRVLFEFAPDACYLSDLKGNFIDGNKAAEEITGYKREELIGKSFLKLGLLSAKQIPKAAALLAQNARGCSTGPEEFTINRKDGSPVYLEIRTHPVKHGNKTLVLGIARDITEEKRAEEALRELEEQNHALVEAGERTGQAIVLLQDTDGVKAAQIFCNQEWARITGYTSEELKRISYWDMFHPRDRKAVNDRVSRRLKGEDIPGQYEITIITKDGREVPVEATSGSTITYKGKPANVGYLRDIAERKRAEEALRESEEKLSAIVQSVGDKMQMMDKEFNIIWANKATKEAFGDDIIGRKCYEVFHRRKQPCQPFPCPTFQTLQDGSFHEYESETIDKDGKHAYHHGTAAVALRGGEGNPQAVVEIARDITERKWMEEELRQSDEYSSTILNRSPNPILVTNPDSSIGYVNPALEELTGYSLTELIGQKAPYSWWTEETLERIKESFEMAFQQGIKAREALFKKKNGERFWVEVTGTPVMMNGQFKYYLANWVDITERKRMEEALRESEERYRALIDLGSRIGEAVVMLQDTADKMAVHVFVNDEWPHITGYTKEELLTMSMLDLIHPRYRKAAMERHRRRIQGEDLPGLYEISIIRKDGTEVPLEVTFAYSSYKGKPANVGYIRDITERKRMERDLKEKNEQLDAQNEELQAQTEELQTAYKQLQEVDEMKDSFLSTVSHELRTPLTSIKGFAEILLSYDEDRETQQEFLAIINEESERLTRLIDDLLDLARLESGRQQWETSRLAISDIITQAVHAVHSLVAQKKLHIQTELAPDLPAYSGDKDKLIQVVTNLLSNAIKFTPESGEIKVKAELATDNRAKKTAEAIKVSVSDTGIGIADKDKKAVFERFKQAGDTLTDKPKGTGLGLPICKEIVEHYGGRIWVESEPGKGSTFYFILPIEQKKKVEISERREEKKVAAPRVGRTILVVDDEDHVRRFLSHEFTKRGYRVFEAPNGKKAISLARKHLPDLITLDILMPEIDGYDVTAILKNDTETKDIPILIISVVEDRQKVFRLGANDYLTKPFKIGMVMEKISKLLRKAQKTVLVVDDDKALVKSLKYKLEKRGISTYVAYNGKEALEVVRKTPPNLILLDIIMPEMDGYEVMSRLKKSRKTAGIPIIVLTGVEIDGGRVQALSLGASEYVTKSGDLNKLFENIESYISDQHN